VASDREASLDLRLAKALSHPLRQRLLQRLNDRVASPVELARELGQPLNLVSYHVRVLERRGMVELVRTRPRRGATEHFYKAAVPAWVEDKQWRELPENVRGLLAGRTLEHIWEDVVTAADSGGLERDDIHVSRTLLELDDQGWQELSAVLFETVKAALRIQQDCAARLKDDPDGLIRSELAIVHYERGDEAPASAAMLPEAEAR
jgi:DNA-binding transcriptional ArsR family regulator